jgi:hypothetical protein
MLGTDFRRWLRRTFLPSRTSPAARGRARPLLECLERRDAPAVYAVTGNADGAGAFQGGAGSAANPFRWTTLRGALNDINANHAAEANTVNLDGGETYALTTGQLTAALQPGGKLTIRALGGGRATLRAIQPQEAESFRVLEFTPDTVAVLKSLVITGGQASEGGGIVNAGTLTLSRSVVTGNQALGGSASKFAQGGGISNLGNLTLKRSSVTGNFVGDGNLEDAEPLFFGAGGGIINSGRLSLTSRSLVAGNQVQSKLALGGGIAQTPGGMEQGGGLSLSRSTVRGNLAQGVSGPAEQQSKFSSMAMGGGIFDAGGTPVSIHTSTIADNIARGGDASSDEFQSAGLAFGGGIQSGFIGGGPTPQLRMVRSTVSGNRALGGNGDGLDGGSAAGGGLSTCGCENLLVVNSTFSGNQARGGTGTGFEAQGGEAVGGGLFFGDFIGSEAAGPEDVETQQVPGAGLLANVTITRNRAIGGDGPGAGGGIFNQDALVEVWNTIIAQNFIDAAANESLTGADVVGDFISTGAGSGHNLIGNADGSTGFGGPGSGDHAGSAANVRNARLRPLANNGGPTKTHALGFNSPAQDRGDNAVLGAPLSLRTDQRGAPRKSGRRVDIGAYEAVFAGQWVPRP